VSHWAFQLSIALCERADRDCRGSGRNAGYRLMRSFRLCSCRVVTP